MIQTGFFPQHISQWQKYLAKNPESLLGSVVLSFFYYNSIIVFGKWGRGLVVSCFKKGVKELNFFKLLEIAGVVRGNCINRV